MCFLPGLQKSLKSFDHCFQMLKLKGSHANLDHVFLLSSLCLDTFAWKFVHKFTRTQLFNLHLVLLKSHKALISVRDLLAYLQVFQCVFYLYEIVKFHGWGYEIKGYAREKTRRNVFYFTSKALFVYEMTFLTFQIFKSHDVINYLGLKQETHFTEKSDNEIKPAFSSKNYVNNVIWKLVSDPFIFQRILYKKEFKVVCVLVWTNFDSFASTYLI